MLPDDPFQVPRFGGGVGALFGWEPFASQAWRLSAGGAFLLGPWASDRTGAYSIEPRARLSFNPWGSFVLLDLYVQGVAPYFFDSKTWAPGPGIGVTARVLGAAADFGVDWLFGDRSFGHDPTPQSNALRLSLSIGYDVLAPVQSLRYPQPEQTRVDLRCEILAAARALAQKRQPATYCDAVRTALDNDRVDKRTAMDNFLAALPPDIGNDLAARHAFYGQCLERKRRLQRECVDCTGKYLLYWFTYTVDPHQIAAALNCIDGVRPDDVVCPDVDARNAANHEADCR
jgi:hypothetical protein